ncbi:hypothetical protein ACHAWO_006846 [Cyclotella atomus]|uniref:Cyclin N-terminal domain-containing protein n=1 Tax=Cyclotella atomus TaxID=382360 RepID=A0ABD3NWG2_9STRA
MAAVFRTTRGDKISLAMSPPREEDDASTSPHLNTLIDLKKGNGNAKPEVMIAAEDKAVNMSSLADRNHNSLNGLKHKVNDEETGQHKDQASGTGIDAKAPSCENLNNNSDPNHEAVRRSSSTGQSEYIPAKLAVHTREASVSSIPHMLGRLSFLGIDAELPSTSLDNSVSSSVDLERLVRASSPYSQQQSSATPIGYQTTQQHHVFQFDDRHAPSNSNMASPVGAVQSRNASRNNRAQTYNTPPHHIINSSVANATISPPHKVSQEALNGQSLQHLEDQLQYQLSPGVESIPPDSPCRKGSADIIEPSKYEQEANNKALSSEREPIPYHETRRTRKMAAQPIDFYSAINSLERYNEGSFDNKVLYAKVFGKAGDQSGFPGIPTKAVPLKPSESTDSVADTWSSASSALNGGRRTASQTGDSLHLRLDISTAGEEKVMDGQQPQSNNLESSLKKVVRSKSSSNLSSDALNDRDTSIRKDKPDNRVTIVEGDKPKRRKRREKKVGVFRPTGDAYTPRMGSRPIKYKPAQERESVDKMSSTMGTIQRPNFRDALRRVAIILHQHIVKIERRFETGVRGVDDTGLFKSSRRDEFSEDKFATPRYKCSMVRVPMACPGVVYSMRKIRVDYRTPSTDEIYDFAHQLFKKVQLSSECSIVCLIYVEKLMEVAKVPLVASTWRPIFMCGLLLASKVWQDLSSWNIEFASVYPQFSLEAINRLEVQFLKAIKWDLYISSSLYAKYYFALRSLLEKSGFRDRYNQMVGGIGGIAASEAMKVSKRSEAVKEEAILQLSRSM